MKKLRLLLCFAGSLLFASGSLIAQKPGYPNGRPSDEVKIAAARADRETRAVLIERLVASKETPGREFDAALRNRVIEELSKETVEQLESRLSSGNINSMALGDTQADLTYTPLSPCRIIDTRIVGGALSGGIPGPSRNFKVAGSSDFELQGGTSGGCGVPVGATSVLINFVAVNAQGRGNLRGSAYPNPIPAVGSIINYQLLTPGLNIANGILFPICDPVGTCTADITLATNGEGVHVVADVLGYMMRFPKEQVRTLHVASSFASGGDLGTTCVEAGSLTITVPVPGKFNVHANVKLRITHVAGAAEEFDVFLSTTSAFCEGISQHSHNWEYTQDWPAGTFYKQLRLDNTYDVPAGLTTIYLNAWRNGLIDTGRVYAAGMMGEFTPN